MKLQKAGAFVAAPLLVLMSPLCLSASPLDPAHVPANAKWVVHVDLEALGETELAEKVREERAEMVDGVRQWLQDRYGIDPREDLEALTMFSESYESHTGTTLLKADYDREKVRSELEKKEGVEKSSWRDRTLYTVEKHKMKKMKKSHRGKRSGDRPEEETSQKEKRKGDSYRKRHGDSDGGTVTIVLFDDKTAIFASSPERAKAAVKLLEGDDSSLEGQDSKLLADRFSEALFYGAAIDLESIEQHKGIFPILRQHERIVWMVGQQDDEIYDKLTLVAQSAEVAEQMKKMVEGFVALCKVWAADNETLTEMTEATEVSLEDRTVHVEWRGETGDALAALKELRGRLKKRFGGAEQPDQ